MTDKPRWGFSDRELATAATVFAGDSLANRVVLISGGGGGMGRAMAYLFTRLGAKVAICGRTEEKLRKTADGVRQQLEASIGVYPMTIRDPDAVRKLVEDVWKDFGHLDVLVNNAGGQFPQAAIDFSVKGWNAVIDTNLNGSWYMMQAAAKAWKTHARQGCVVNIVATVNRGMPQVAHTCAARAGVIYLSKTLATEWAPLNIRVNCVAPGTIETEGFSVYPPEGVASFKDSNPMRTLGDVMDVAQAVAYLSAESGKYITGEVLTVDGGHEQWGDVWPAGRPEYFDLD